MKMVNFCVDLVVSVSVVLFGFKILELIAWYLLGIGELSINLVVFGCAFSLVAICVLFIVSTCIYSFSKHNKGAKR